MQMIWIMLFSCGNTEKEEETEDLTSELEELTDEQACIEECQDFHNFWQACFDEITNQGFFIDCYQEIDSLEAALAEAGQASEARLQVYNDWNELGYVYTCESADDLLDNCISRAQSAFVYLNEEEASARGDLCREEANTPVEIAMENLDCQGFLDALTGG